MFNEEKEKILGLTYKEMFKIFVSVIPFMIIFVIIACSIVGIVGATLSLNKNEYSVKGVIDFTYSGIENGKDPNGNVFNPNELKDIQLINEVIVENNLDLDSNKIKDYISIEGIVPDAYKKILKEKLNSDSLTPEQISQLNYNPTSFMITIKDIDLNKSKILLDNLMKKYIENFSIKYNKNNLLFNLSLENTDYLDYANQIILIKSNLLSIQKILSEFQEVASYSSIKLNNLKSQIEIELLSVNRIIENMKYGGITKYEINNNITKLYLEKKYDLLNKQIETKTDELTELKSLLDVYKSQYPEITAGGENSNINLRPSQTFDGIFVKAEALNNEISILKIEQNDYCYIDNDNKTLKGWNITTKISNDSENDLLNDVKSSISNTKMIIDEYNDLIKEGNKYISSNSANIKSSALILKDNYIVPWKIMFLVGAAVGVVVGAGFGLIYPKIPKLKIRKKSKQK